MLKIRVHENDQCLLEKPVPAELAATGCVILLQETFVATLGVGGSVECGSFSVSMTEDDATDGHGDLAEMDDSRHGDSRMEDTITVDSEGKLLSNDVSGFSLGTEAASTQIGDSRTANEKDVSLQVYARIPGYDLQALIGRGGMGLVWKAIQLSTNRMVALKTIHPRMLHEPKSRKRFQREVELAARLTHPNIARVYEAGEVARQNYFSMELVDGLPWSQHVRTNQLQKSDVLQQLLQVLDAVAYAHTQGVIHRDLKPSNILVDKQGKAYVVDFGLAKYNDADGEELSKQGDIIGTQNFMSPEQASGNVSCTDSRSDVYSLGAVVLYLLGNGITGRKPERKANNDGSSKEVSLQKQAAAILRNDPRLRRILVKALSPEPDQRYENASTFASDLRDYLEVRLTEITRGEHQKNNKRSGWWVAGVGLVLAAVGIGGFVFWRDNNPPLSDVDKIEEPLEEPADSEGKRVRAAERDRAVKEKFGNRFASAFQSTGDAPVDAIITTGVGHQEPAEYPVVHPLRWPLVGFNLATYPFQKRLIIKTLQPIFRNPDTGETETSEMFGRLHPRCEFHQVLAPRSFRVVGIEAVGGKRLHALRLNFAASSNGEDDQAAASTEYSPWFGEPLNDVIEKRGGTGQPAIGIVCSYSTDIHQIGLILDDRSEAR